MNFGYSHGLSAPGPSSFGRSNEQSEAGHLNSSTFKCSLNKLSPSKKRILDFNLKDSTPFKLQMVFPRQSEFRRWLRRGPWIRVMFGYNEGNARETQYFCEVPECDAIITVISKKEGVQVKANQNLQYHRCLHSQVNEELKDSVLELKDSFPALTNEAIATILRTRFPLITSSQVHRCLAQFKESFSKSSGHEYLWW